MNVLICFEVSGKLEQVRQELSAKGYMSSWKIKKGGRDEIICNLPSNALWKKGKEMSPTKAKEELKKIAGKLGVKVVRTVALLVSAWDGVSGTPNGVTAETVTQSVEDET